MTLPWRDCTAYGSAVGDAVKGWRQAGPTLEPTAARVSAQTSCRVGGWGWGIFLRKQRSPSGSRGF